MSDPDESLIQSRERDITRDHAIAAHKRLHENLNTNSIPIIQANNVAEQI